MGNNPAYVERSSGYLRLVPSALLSYCFYTQNGPPARTPTREKNGGSA